MTTSRHRATAALAATAIGILLLAGCAAVSSAPSPATEKSTAEEPAADEQKTNDEGADGQASSHATVAVAGREFTFALDTCVVYDDTELSVAGSGGETGTDVPSYLDGDIMSLGPDALGELRFDIGADGPFQTTDTFIAFGAPTGDPGFSVVAEGDGYTATGPAWDENGTDLGMATARLTCG